MAANASPQEQQLLAEYVIDQLYRRTSGRADAECERNYPRDVYFVGNLRSDDTPAQPDANRPHLPELLNKLAPVAFGAEFRIRPADGGAVRIRLEWTCYYRVFPTHEQQSQHHQELTGGRGSRLPSTALNAPPQDEDDADDEAGAEEISKEPELEEDVDNAAAGGRSRGRTDALMLRFRKIPCSAEGDISLDQHGSGGPACDCSDLDCAITAELARAHDIAANDPESIRTSADPYAHILVPETALTSAAAYERFTITLQARVMPLWRWEVRCNIRWDVDDPGVLILSLMFANRTAEQLSPSGKAHPSIEPFVFDTAAQFSFRDIAVEPFSIELAPKGFRYNRQVWARSFNCAVECSSPIEFHTTHAPIYVQDRLLTRADPVAPFAELASDPLPVLDRIVKAMEGYRDQWTSAEESYRKTIPHWEERHSAEFAADRGDFEREILSFERGVDLVRKDDDIRLAFRLTNETFLRSGKHTNKTAWRLFQLVFLVSEIPGIAALADKPGGVPDDLERADIIYFPTGGGKTEAYLAVLTFHCFFDRLRGKSAGVTAWTRFPLRLLTLQQTQRVADVICMADLVRRAQSDPRLMGPSVAGFGVGYFVGKTSTPNEIVNADDYQHAGAEDSATWAIAKDDTARQSWRRLMHCPSCWTGTVHVDFDAAQVRLIHRCTERGCAFPDGRIPVYVIDNEIYRYLPSVLVGTIDKLAGIGNQRKMALIFGSIDGYCRAHGFFKGKCCQKDCDGKSLVFRAPTGLSGPTIFVQDELHLLKEGLGTFDGHYETFVQELLATLSPTSRLKIIASSATIENFERQIEHLYGASPPLATMFPGPGPELGGSFYAHTLDYPQRLFAGLIPHNKTIFNAILELLEYYHCILQELLQTPTGAASPFGGSLRPGTDEWFALLDAYVTSLTYFLSSRDLNSVHTDLDGHVSPQLQRMGLSPLRIFELTGSTSTDEVSSTLEHLDRPKPGQEQATAVLATYMISHGVDIDRLNALIFYGMPRQNAEYIQAASRVGRANVGLVFMCHHPARERDQSHYSLFGKYHEYLGQLVEPVAINRWATFSINRTLPGLFMGVLLQLMANRAEGRDVNRFYRVDYVRQQIAAGRIRADDFIPLLERAYRVGDSNDPARRGFREEIRLRVQQFLDQIAGASPSTKWVSNALIPRPMRSLRDFDEPIPIALDRAGTQWSGYFDRAGGGS